MEIIINNNNVEFCSNSDEKLSVFSFYDDKKYTSTNKKLILDKKKLMPGEYIISTNDKISDKSLRVSYKISDINSYVYEIIDNSDYEKKIQEKMKNVKVSVTIPTYNAGSFFDKVLNAIFNQCISTELVIVDSGSKDETLSVIKKYQDSGCNIKLIAINKSEFQHGKTRNFAISQATGEYVAVLTQDALPYNRYWLYELIDPMLKDPLIAGTYGKHIPYIKTNIIERCRIITKFDVLDKKPPVYSFKKYEDFEKLPEGQQLFYIDYFSNSSALRKSVWEKVPYPEAPWSEDKAWVKLLYKNNYKKGYCSNSIIFHSHSYGFSELYKRWYASVKNTSYAGITTYYWYRNDPKWVKKHLDRAKLLLQMTKYSKIRKGLLLLVEYIRDVIIYKAAIKALKDYDFETQNNQ